VEARPLDWWGRGFLVPLKSAKKNLSSDNACYGL